jgi:hypothetical protein
LQTAAFADESFARAVLPTSSTVPALAKKDYLIAQITALVAVLRMGMIGLVFQLPHQLQT